GINRIANIVESMREMSQSSKEIKEKINIYSTLNTSLTMAYNRSKQVSKIYLNNELFNIDSIDKNKFEFYAKVQKQRIEQVWIIIINNALDALINVDDYEKRVLNISIYEDADYLNVKFKDNAGGIKTDMIDSIFDAFVSSKEHSGMGVGLNIAKKILTEQDASITAYNEDYGAVFKIKFKKNEE
nr:HAMP domain-containing histidine kinase [Aliarcobacter sp.]